MKPPHPYLNATNMCLLLAPIKPAGKLTLWGICLGPGAYYAPTLAGKRCSPELAAIDYYFRI
jgi:hypothetical protein